MPSTVTVQSVLNFCSAHAELMPLANVGGYSNEPGLSLANDVFQEILAPPFAWRWNRKTMPLLTTGQARQDSLFAGACAFVLGGCGGVGIDLASNNGVTESGNTVTVKTLDPHNFQVGQTVYMTGNTVAAYNSTETLNLTGSTWSGGWVITAVPTATSFQFTHVTGGLAVSGAAGITDFGWCESASMVNEDDTSAPRAVKYLTAARTLRPTGVVGIPDKVSVYESGTVGILRVRFSVVPSSNAWGVTLVYQAAPPLITSLASTWAPVPDDEMAVVRAVFLALAFRFFGSARAENEFRRAQAAIMGALGGDDAESAEEYITPESLMGAW